jgi:hypothetical protein
MLTFGCGRSSDASGTAFRYGKRMAAAVLAVALPFAGAFVGAFAFTLALLYGEAAPAAGALVMAVYCTAEFLVNADVT